MKVGTVLSISVGLLLVGAVIDVHAASPSTWMEPIPVTEVNSDAEEWSPYLSFDGLTLYFTRVRSDASYFGRVFEATRDVPFGPFSAVTQTEGGLSSSPGHVKLPWVSQDGLRMYYSRQLDTRFSLMLSKRESTDASWPEGVSIWELNQFGDRIQSPRLTPDELEIFFDSSDISGGKGYYDIWTASRPDRDAPFSNLRNVEEVNTEFGELGPYISADGLTLVFQSDRNGPVQIFAATRASRQDPFGDVEHLSMLDAPGHESLHPCLTSDGNGLYFVRQQDGEGRTKDIWFSQRFVAYYVNGAGGSDENDGLSFNAAFASIQKAIDTAEDGDVVNVNPGVYRESIHFLGKAITVRSMGGAAVLEAPDEFAVSFYMGEGEDCVLKNFVIANSYVGIFVSGSSPTITNVTVVGNQFGIEAYRDADPKVSNSIVWGNALSDLYGCSATYSCIGQGADGEGNFSETPRFADPENGDYHLRSARGRYWPEHNVWVLDDVTSPCVDAGDPAADFSGERKPNGGRLNVGAYGGTPFASMSEPPVSADFNGDGVVDETDLEMFTDLWEQQAQPGAEEPVFPGRR